MVERDEHAPHQIIIEFAALGLSISCNCLMPGMIMGTVQPGHEEQMWRMYDNPENHDISKERFVPGTRGIRRIAKTPIGW